MSSFIRRAGAQIANFIKSVLDPIAEADRVKLYVKEVGGVSQLFARASDGTITQLTPLAMGAWAFGPSIDGTATMDGVAVVAGMVPAGNVYTAPGGASARDYQFQSLVIEPGITFRTSGNRVFASDTIDNNGTISHGGADSTSVIGGAGATAGTMQSTQSNGGVGGTNAVGNNGANIGGILPPPYGATNGVNNGGAIATDGGAGQVRFKGGGGGGGATANSGGTAGSISASSGQAGAPTLISLLNGVSGTRLGGFWNGGSGGGGGAGGTAGQGGGGGGGGGLLVVGAPRIIGSGTIHVDGGDGGPGTGTGGGGGGAGGGLLTVAYSLLLENLLSAAGGIGGASGGGGGGNGGDGQDGYYFSFQV